MWYLQPIFLLLYLLIRSPGRDTQVDFQQPEDFVLLWDAVLPFVSLLLTMGTGWILDAGRVLLACALWHLFNLYDFAMMDRISSFTRKYGRWKHRRFFPRCFLLLSSATVSAFQVPYAMAYAPGRARFYTPTRWMFNDEPTGPTFAEIFKLAVDPQCPKNDFFYPGFMDLLPFDDDSEEFLQPIPPRLLHLSGYDQEWSHEHAILSPFDDSSSKPICSDTTNYANRVEIPICNG